MRLPLCATRRPLLLRVGQTLHEAPLILAQTRFEKNHSKRAQIRPPEHHQIDPKYAQIEDMRPSLEVHYEGRVPSQACLHCKMPGQHMFPNDGAPTLRTPGPQAPQTRNPPKAEFPKINDPSVDLKIVAPSSSERLQEKAPKL